MHSAPAVNFPVGRSRFQGLLIGLTSLLGAATGLLWQAQLDLSAWRLWLFALSYLLTCAVATEIWRRSPHGTLRWDGQTWHWTVKNYEPTGPLTVHLDLQYFLLVSLSPDQGARIWLWPERRSDELHWNDLRRAVFSNRGANSDLAVKL